MTIEPTSFRLTNDHSGDPLDSLPGWFEPELVALDEQLRDAANRVEPAGLNRRVFVASAPLLPAKRLRLTTADATASSALRSRLQHQWMGRLAMAASLGLVFTVALISMRPSPSGLPEPIARGDTMLAAYSQVLAEDPRTSVDHESSYLVDTMALRSKDVVRNEMLAILGEF